MKEVKDLDLKICKYKFKKFILYIGSEEFEVESKFISELAIEKEFEGYIHPYIYTIFSVPNRIYRKMRENANKLKVHLTIKTGKFRQDDIADFTEKPPEEDFINQNFKLVIAESSPILNTEFQEAIEEQLELENDTGNPQHTTNLVALLYNDDNLKACQVMCNKIVTQCTLTDALTKELQEAGFKNVLLSPATNETMYSEFMMLPTRADESIYHICNDYGIHNEGTMIFFDYDINYLIRKNGLCTAWRPREIKKTYVIFNPNVLNGRITQGCYRDDEEKVNYVTMQHCKMVEASAFINENYATNFISLDTKSGESVNKISDTTTFPNRSKTPNVLLKANSGNPNTSEAVKKWAESQKTNWNVVIDSIDLTMMTPNKEFQLVFISSKLSKYSGTYRIRALYASFKKSDGDWFTATVNAQFTGI